MGVAAIPFIMQGASTGMDYVNSAGIKEQGKLQAEMEDVAVLQRETDRKADLLRAISSQRARASGAGITMEGSPLSVIQEQIRQERQDTSRDVFNTNIAKQSAIYSARLKSGSLKTRGALSLLSAGLMAAETAPVDE